ncbi:L,D-transpeptidase [Roseibium aquae]|uniref:L,D-transpeptidase n=1 Tax=Roseibium aquae TaxID=1323746 RepID=A0A916TNF6_9HYPH|nr:L,D-transpeptidase [Roseibium aquae]GGB59439.1 L,D-transpeptidase [Roseibium aquae]
MLSRRVFLMTSAGAILAGCNTTRTLPPAPGTARSSAADSMPAATAFAQTDYTRIYGPRPDEPFPLPAVDISQVDPIYYRQRVNYATSEGPGTIIVDTPNRFLYYVEPDGKAMRYGVGIGRAGFDWGGTARIGAKREWPKWFPPKEMRERQPELEKYANGMEPGLNNPLGARALYIYEGQKDTLYRVHGTPEAWSIGKAVSSGCVRMLQQDIIDLYGRVALNSKIVVKQA